MYIYKDTFTYTDTDKYTYTYTYTDTYTYTFNYTDSNTHAYSYKYTYTHTHILTHTLTNVLTLIHTFSCIQTLNTEGDLSLPKCMSDRTLLVLFCFFLSLCLQPRRSQHSVSLTSNIRHKDFRPPNILYYHGIYSRCFLSTLQYSAFHWTAQLKPNQKPHMCILSQFSRFSVNT